MKPMQLYFELARQIEQSPTIPPCQDSDPEAWFSEDGMLEAGRKAKKMCQSCPVINACATYAIAAEEMFGVWGGMTALERRKIRLKRL